MHFLWKYFQDRQPPAIRVLHLVILCLVLDQILISNFMGFTKNGHISSQIFVHYCTWIHIGSGLALIPITIVFIFLELRHRGLRYFFAYIYGDTSQLRRDFQQLTQFRLPEADPGGIAAAVQGLGLGALSLVLLSGFTWFLAWTAGASWANTAKELHETLTGLVELYVVGHGLMGVLHLFYTFKKSTA